MYYIDNLCRDANIIANRSGFWSNEKNRNIPTKLCLMHSEISEALEELRNNQPNTMRIENGKPEGFVVELADLVIRVADVCGEMNLDLDGAIEAKMAYNRTRPYKHNKQF